MDRLKTHSIEATGTPTPTKILYGDRWDNVPTNRTLVPLTVRDPAKAEPELLWDNNDDLIMVEMAI